MTRSSTLLDGGVGRLLPARDAPSVGAAHTEFVEACANAFEQKEHGYAAEPHALR